MCEEIGIALPLWAKKSPESSHLLEYHLIDTSSVCHEYLQRNPHILDLISSFLEINRNKALNLLCFLSSIHDLGKICSGFQHQHDNYIPHTKFGFALLWNDDIWDIIQSAIIGNVEKTRKVRGFIKSIVRPSMMHHGNPGERNDELFKDICKKISDSEIDDAITIVNRMKSLYLGDQPIFSSIPSKGYEKAELLITGIISLSDWIASDDNLFKYTDDCIGVIRYSEISQEEANRAFDTTLSPLCTQEFLNYRNFEDLFGFNPSNTQKILSEMEVLGPSLTIVEDATGSGKTEAAIMLALKNIRSGIANGITFALPTKSTSNLMFERMHDNHDSLLRDDGIISLVHGSAKEFLEDFKAIDDNNVREDEWFGDNNYKKMFSNLAICTVDQVLFSTLPGKYEPLRLLSLIGHVVVIDEIHSFDAYTFRLIRCFIELCKAYGIPVIALSATLPRKMRENLIHAAGSKIPLESEDYPLVTSLDYNSGVTEIPSSPSARSTRDVKIRYTSDEATIVEELMDLASAGFRVAWIRNTVDDAISTYDRLPDSNSYQKHLVHSRFTLRDRLAKESMLFDKCGKNADFGSGLIVIGTQIMEQSMDIDFDRIYSDLAPADSLIQRIGRDQRFGRSQIPCEFVINGPKIVEKPSETWYSDYFRSASYVYLNHYSLWKTAVEMNDSILHIPDDYRRVIESAYSEPEKANGLYSSYQKYVEVCGGASSSAFKRHIDVEEGYGGSEGEWKREDALTRNGDNTIRALLLDESGHPICGDPKLSIVAIKKKFMEKSNENYYNSGKWKFITKIVMRYSRDQDMFLTDGFTYDSEKGVVYVQSN